MNKYIVTLFAFVAALTMSAQVTIDRTTAPTPGPAAKPVIGSYESFELKNGLKVFVVENHKLPRITMQLILDRDPIVEGDKAGYVSIAGDLIGSGTTNRTKAELDEEVDFMGANFGTGSSSVRISGLSKYTDNLIEILADVVLNPSFPEEEFDKLKSQMISGLKANSDDPDAISGKLRQSVIYGLDHPYGEVMTESTVESVSIEDCKAYYNTYFRPNIGYMVVIGDITVKDAKKKLNKALKKWKASDVPTHQYEKIAEPSSLRIAMVDKPSAVQSVVWLGNVIDLPHGHKDIEALRVANQILGGGMSGRLFSNLREDKAFTYGAYSSFGIDELNSTFSASAKVRNEVTDSAIVEFLYEINRMSNEPVSEEDLVAAKASLSGSFGRSLESSASAASFALDIARYGLPSDYYNNYLARIEAVTADDVMRVAKEYMGTENLTIAVVGKAQDIASKLSAFGDVEYYDADGNRTDEPSFLFIPEGVVLKDVIQGYINARGGADALSQITAIDQKMSLSVPGMPAPLSMREAKISPSLSLQEQTMQGMVVGKVLYKDGVAKQSGMQGEKIFEGEELESIQEAASKIIPELDWLDDSSTLTFDGQTLLNGKDVYQISSADDETFYFDVKSGLLYMTSQMQETPQGDVSITSVYEEWTEVGGMKFPKKVTQSAGPQTFSIEFLSTELNENVDPSIFK